MLRLVWKVGVNLAKRIVEMMVEKGIIPEMMGHIYLMHRNGM